jgi:TRAP-type C4-dicarboxylate transport system substrate-binding protein
MKKILSLTVAAAMALSLSACGGSAAPATTAAPAETTAAAAAETTAAAAAETTAAAAETQAAGTELAGGQTYKFTLASMYNDPANIPDFNGFGWGIKIFMDLVKERTNGQVESESYWAGVMGGDIELSNMVMDGDIDIYYGSPTASIDPVFAAKSIPYLFSDYDQVKELYASPNAPLFNLIHDRAKENLGIEMIAAGTGTFRDVMNSKHEVKVPSDLKDLTLRSYEDYIVFAFWNELCNATVLPYSECYTAFQTGTCDGGEFANTIMVQQKYYEVAKYVTDIHWQWVGHSIFFNGELWDSLPADLQQVLQECAWEAFAQEYEIEQKDEAKAYDELEAHGIEVYHLTDEERQQWIDYARTTYDYIASELGEDVFADIMKAAGIDWK